MLRLSSLHTFDFYLHLITNSPTSHAYIYCDQLCTNWFCKPHNSFMQNYTPLEDWISLSSAKRKLLECSLLSAITCMYCLVSCIKEEGPMLI